MKRRTNATIRYLYTFPKIYMIPVIIYKFRTILPILKAHNDIGSRPPQSHWIRSPKHEDLDLRVNLWDLRYVTKSKCGLMTDVPQQKSPPIDS